MRVAPVLGLMTALAVCQKAWFGRHAKSIGWTSASSLMYTQSTVGRVGMRLIQFVLFGDLAMMPPIGLEGLDVWC